MRGEAQRAVLGDHDRRQLAMVIVHRGVCGDGGGAACLQPGQHPPFCQRGPARGRIVQLGQRGAYGVVVAAALQSQRALRGCGQEDGGIETFADVLGEPDAS